MLRVVDEDAGLSKRLATALEARGMSQGALEAAAELPDSYVSKILKGKRPNIGFQTLTAIADALDVSYAWLATGEGAMNRGELPASPIKIVRELLERYPNATAAAAMAPQLGIGAEAIGEVGGEAYASKEDLSVQAWLDRMREVDARNRRDALEPGRAAKREALSQAKVDERRTKKPGWGKR